MARIPIPGRLIRETGTVIIEGIGGDATHAEFAVDAIPERIDELTVALSEQIGAPIVLESLTATRSPGPGSGSASGQGSGWYGSHDCLVAS